MADVEYDDRDGALRRHPGAGMQGWLRLAGGMVSLALVIGFAFWGYKLAVRDVTGVPVVRALEGPMRVAPADPGGEVADNQGLAVNGVAEAGAAAAMPDTLTLAPRPVDLAPEDLAGLAVPSVPGLADVSATPPVPGEVLPPAGDLALAAAPPVESASPIATAVDAALAEALGLGTGDGVEVASADLDPAVLDPADLDPAVLPPEVVAPAGAITVSPRPRARPATSAAQPTEIADLPPVQEVDPATIAVGTRLVQFGAYDSADEARLGWASLQGRFPELMAEKAMVLQPAESGGRTFWRLRAHGFEDETDARRFCTAFVAQDAVCIPVPQR